MKSKFLFHFVFRKHKLHEHREKIILTFYTLNSW